MRLSKFKEKYRISDTPALDAIARYVDARVLSESLERTINDGFRGAATFESEIYDDGCVNICIDFLALTIRKTLEGIFGRELVKIRMEAARNAVKITFDLQDISLISDRALNEITKTARSARFEIQYIENSFTLTAKMVREFIHTVHSVSANDLTARLRLIIFE